MQWLASLRVVLYRSYCFQISKFQLYRFPKILDAVPVGIVPSFQICKLFPRPQISRFYGLPRIWKLGNLDAKYLPEEVSKR